MRFKKIFIFLCIIWATLVFSQQLEVSALTKVSILTVGPGNELNSKFGHSAIRFQDPTIGMDVVYNYGMFDFNAPNFYIEFTRGKLDYWLAKQNYRRFLYGYQIEKRSVKEQILNLTPTQVKQLYRFLENNYLPENRFYKYDFFFDNCTTRLPGALSSVLGNTLDLAKVDMVSKITYRDLIHQNLKLNSWSNFGIDLALGSVIDKRGTPFLPINLLNQLKESEINSKPLVEKELDVLAANKSVDKQNIVMTPLFWLSALLIMVICITYLDFKKNRRSRWLDFILFFVTGLAGALILFLWFATDHQATKSNFNALWAFAPNLLIGFLLLKKQLPSWFKSYLIVLLALIGVTLILWILKIQLFSPLILFILVSLLVRYLFLVRLSKPGRHPLI